MIVRCVWEHNGNDTLLYAVDLPGAFTRSETRDIALKKMQREVASYLTWAGYVLPQKVEVQIVQDAACELAVCDADSDVLFEEERRPLDVQVYARLKALALKSAADFHALYQALPDKETAAAPERRTFYGKVPRTATEMYAHTKSVNEYYFGEIGVPADNDGTILECRVRGFAALEQQPDYLTAPPVEGSYGEEWSLCKLLRRFIWHDRIHAKAMYRMAVKVFGQQAVLDVFCFEANNENNMRTDVVDCRPQLTQE